MAGLIPLSTNLIFKKPNLCTVKLYNIPVFQKNTALRILSHSLPGKITKTLKCNITNLVFIIFEWTVIEKHTINHLLDPSASVVGPLVALGVLPWPINHGVILDVRIMIVEFGRMTQSQSSVTALSKVQLYPEINKQNGIQ